MTLIGNQPVHRRSTDYIISKHPFLTKRKLIYPNSENLPDDQATLFEGQENYYPVTFETFENQLYGWTPVVSGIPEQEVYTP